MDGGRKGEDQSTYNKHCRSYGHFNAGKIEMQTILTDSFFSMVFGLSHRTPCIPRMCLSW